MTGRYDNLTALPGVSECLDCGTLVRTVKRPLHDQSHGIDNDIARALAVILGAHLSERTHGRFDIRERIGAKPSAHSWTREALAEVLADADLIPPVDLTLEQVERFEAAAERGLAARRATPEVEATPDTARSPDGFDPSAAFDCALCLYAPEGRMVEPAVTVIEGYAVCYDHMGYVAQGQRFAALRSALGEGS